MAKAFLPIILLVFLFLLSACETEKPEVVASSKSCTSCHRLETDQDHQQACTSCHGGISPALDKVSAHKELLKTPAHPQHFARNCGGCHKEITDTISTSLHFTLDKSVNLFRQSFGAQSNVDSFTQTPVNEAIETELQLADDLLRRRCFRCHLYSAGDTFPLVNHGTGCAACHLTFENGEMGSHIFQKPGDEQCLSCHYGNYVGFDYYGRFEHDLNIEYRTPYTTKEKYFRPYGVEYHQLKADIHQQRGMSCIDCHSGRELMSNSGRKPSCKNCHSKTALEDSLPARVELQDDTYILLGSNGQKHPVPLMHNPAHDESPQDITCQACHAQWTFNDTGKHFLRSDVDEYTSWSNLSVQGNFELETIIEHNNVFENTELAPEMTDKLTGEAKLGLWHKGFTQRRWETIILGRDEAGRISPMRPLLDYSLSWIDEEEEVRFDSVPSRAINNGLRSYVPHTTGPAGLFYRERLKQFLASEAATSTKAK